MRLADIVRRYGKSYREKHALSVQHKRILRAIETCRTAALGGHASQCSQCGEKRVWYNSCRNRHCPQCQCLARAQWLNKRKLELLPVNYFHTVFTVPAQIAAIALQNKEVVYDILFRATAQTLSTIARDPQHLGAHIGYFAVLHTWGQNLHLHPHLHCVIPGGGIAVSGEPRWVRSSRNYFLPVQVLSAMFRRVFLAMMRVAFKKGKLQFFSSLEALRQPNSFYRYLEPLEKMPWVVYSKPPFGGPEKALEYLGRYTHRVAISNERLLSMDDGKVSFLYKDYREKRRRQKQKQKQKQKVMTLDADNFLHSFLLHTLPRGFQRIRHFGLFSNPVRNKSLALCRKLLGVAAPAQPEPVRLTLAERYELLTGHPLMQCPICKTPTMVVVELFQPVPSFENSS